jgi:queuine tRNA-ribosyltransferase
VFELIATDGEARRGRLTTAHGTVQTPVFMPVGTRGTVKSLSPDDLRDAGAEMVLGNTYHLMLRPGHEVVHDLGGLHRFMGWDRSILTDSGGFQVFSLSRLRRLREEGVTFRSPIDGAEHFLSPELAVQVQHALGSDIVHPLDECLGNPATHEETERSMALTLRWLERSRREHERLGAGPALFGIVQGGSYADLRERSTRETVAFDLDGYAVGGMAVGEPKPVMYDLTERVVSLLPPGQPRYVMGVGKPEDLVELVARGADMFDCVLPTRNARNGQCFTADGPLAIKHARFVRDPAPLEDGCDCYTCARFSRAYLRHLYMADELLAYRLLTMHNVRFFIRLMESMQTAVAGGSFAAFRARFFHRYRVSSREVLHDDTGGSHRSRSSGRSSTGGPQGE